jgi:hypothetical protein
MALTVSSRRSGPPPAPTPGRVDRGEAPRRDLLRTHSKLAASVLALLGIGMFFASFSDGVHSGLPTVAFDWVFGIQVVRAAVAFAIFAVLIALIVRGWGGLWPQRITTTSLEFPEAEQDILQGTADATQITRELLRLLATMNEPSES